MVRRASGRPGACRPERAALGPLLPIRHRRRYPRERRRSCRRVVTNIGQLAVNEGNASGRPGACRPAAGVTGLIGNGACRRDLSPSAPCVTGLIGNGTPRDAVRHRRHVLQYGSWKTTRLTIPAANATARARPRTLSATARGWLAEITTLTAAWASARSPAGECSSAPSASIALLIARAPPCCPHTRARAGTARRGSARSASTRSTARPAVVWRRTGRSVGRRSARRGPL